MKDIDGAIVRQMVMHLFECRQQKLVEFRIAHVVVQDLASGFFHVHIVRRVRKHKVGFHAIHQSVIAFCFGGIPAQNDVLSQMPEVALFGKARLLQFRFHIEVIFLDFLTVDLVEQRLDLRGIKAGLAKVEVRILDVLQKISQQGIIPCTRDLIERNVQGFFPGLVDVHHRTRHFGIAQLHRYGQSLVAADDCHIGIDHQRICEPELRDGVLDLLVLFVPRLQLFPGIVCGRLKYGHRQHLQFSSRFHVSPPNSDSHAHDPGERHEKGAEQKARLHLISIFLRMFSHLAPFRVFPVHGCQDLIFRIVNRMYTDTPGVEHRKHTDNLTHPHPLPSSRIDNPSNNSDCRTSAAVFLHLRHGTPFHSFYRPRSEKTYAACNIPPGKLENRTVSDHCSLSARESVRTLDSAVPPTHPVAVTGSSPFPAGPVPGSNP